MVLGLSLDSGLTAVSDLSCDSVFTAAGAGPACSGSSAVSRGGLSLVAVVLSLGDFGCELRGVSRVTVCRALSEGPLGRGLAVAVAAGLGPSLVLLRLVRVSPGDRPSPSASVGETGVVMILGTVVFLVCRVSLIVR